MCRVIVGGIDNAIRQLGGIPAPMGAIFTGKCKLDRVARLCVIVVGAILIFGGVVVLLAALDGDFVLVHSGNAYRPGGHGKGKLVLGRAVDLAAGGFTVDGKVVIRFPVCKNGVRAVCIRVCGRSRGVARNGHRFSAFHKVARCQGFLALAKVCFCRCILGGNSVLCNKAAVFSAILAHANCISRIQADKFKIFLIGNVTVVICVRRSHRDFSSVAGVFYQNCQFLIIVPSDQDCAIIVRLFSEIDIRYRARNGSSIDFRLI